MTESLDLSGVPGTPVLVGVGGSHAYGLAHAGSDIDYRGCYVVPTREFFGLNKPKETYDRHDPDMALHEVGKLLWLASKANPTVLELFFYSEYPVRTEIGDLLIANRDLFITERIRSTHIGYAYEQFSRLKRREGSSFSADTAKRTEKHARHILRLVLLAERTLTTGEFDIVVRDRDEIFDFGKLPYEEMLERAEAEIERVKDMPSVLPPEPDMQAIDDLLVQIREMSLFPSAVAWDRDVNDRYST